MQDEKESRETMDTGYSKWRKLDNAALAFPLVTGKDDTRQFYHGENDTGLYGCWNWK